MDVIYLAFRELGFAGLDISLKWILRSRSFLVSSFYYREYRDTPPGSVFMWVLGVLNLAFGHQELYWVSISSALAYFSLHCLTRKSESLKRYFKQRRFLLYNFIFICWEVHKYFDCIYPILLPSNSFWILCPKYILFSTSPVPPLISFEVYNSLSLISSVHMHMGLETTTLLQPG